MVNVRAPGRLSLGATPKAKRAASVVAPRSPSPASQPPSQASLSVINETLVMHEGDADEESEADELDALDVLRSDNQMDDDEVDELADDEVDDMERTPKALKLAIRTGRTKLSPSPSTTSTSDNDDDNSITDPALVSPSLTEPSVEKLFDQRADQQAAATHPVAAVVPVPPAVPAPQINAVASSSRASVASSRHFFHGKTFHIAGRRPVKPGPLAEVDDIRHAIKDAGGVIVKISQNPTFVVEVGELSAAMERRIDEMAGTELLDVPAFRKLFATGLRRLAKASKQEALSVTSRSERLGEGGRLDADEARHSEQLSVVSPPKEVAMVAEGAEEMRVAAEAVPGQPGSAQARDEASAGPSAADTTTTAEPKVLFQDKQGVVLVFELQPALPESLKANLQRLIEDHGGRLSTDLSEVDMRLVDPTTDDGQAIAQLEKAEGPHWRCRPWHWVATSVVRGKLVKPKAMDSPQPVFVRRATGKQLKLCVMPEVEGKEAVERSIRANGGVLAVENADVLVVASDPSDPATAARARQFTGAGPDVRLAASSWVEESVKAGQRCRLPARLAGAVPAPSGVAQASAPVKVPRAAPPNQGTAGRPVGTVRHDFTDDDDRWMIRYMAAVLHHQKANPGKGQPIGATGNRIFQDMCDEEDINLRPWAAEHTWQSWRNRYNKKRTVGYERALDRRLKKLADGVVDCPMLAQVAAKRRGEKPAPAKSSRRRNAVNAAPARAATAELESEQSENIEDTDMENAQELASPGPNPRASPQLRAASSRSRSAAAAQEIEAATRPLSNPRSVAPSEEPPSQIGEMAPEAFMPGDAAGADGRLDDNAPSPIEPFSLIDVGDDRSGGMDYEPEPPLQLSIPAPQQSPAQQDEQVVDQPVSVSASATDPMAAEAAAFQSDLAVDDSAPPHPNEAHPSAPIAVEQATTPISVDASEDDMDADNDDDESGQAMRYMKTTLAALAGGSSADAIEFDTDDEREASVAQRQQAPPSLERAADDEIVLLSGDEDISDDSDVGGPGGATLAMQALMDHAAEPMNSDDSSDEGSFGQTAPRSQQAAAARRSKSRSTSPAPPARSSHGNTPPRRSPLPQEAQATPTEPTIVFAAAHGSATPTSKPTSVRREKRGRLSRPAPRKSLDMPGIGAHVPHFDLGGSAIKKPRLSGRFEGESSHTPVPQALTAKDRAIQWAIDMETKYALDRRKCSPFLRAVWPDVTAAERILFASLPLEDGHVWTAEEDDALLEMEGPMLDKLEASLGLPVCYRRLRLLNKHRRGPPPATGP